MAATLFLDALKGCNTKGPPVWFMRQAGRYMPSYRKIRNQLSFLEMCRRPEVVAEVTLLPVNELDVDAAILFSDILLLPDALGLGLSFEEGEGPRFARPLKSPLDIANLPKVSMPSALAFVGDSIRLLKKDLKVPLIGFAGAPFTVAGYMIEGKSSQNWRSVKQWLMREPESFDLLIDQLTDLTIDYLKMQIEAGAEAIQLFDSWADTLSDDHFCRFSKSPLKKIVEALKPTGIPVILFSRGSSLFARRLFEAAPAAISLDWRCDIGQIRRDLPGQVALQGNLDPDWLYAPKERLYIEVDRILDTMKEDPAFVFNLGHGIAPDVAQDTVKSVVERIKARR